jgi:DNA primase
MDGYRLSLGGVGSAALMGFLERNPGIQNIYLALDNDKAGKDAANRIIKELLSDKRFSHMKITTAPPPSGYKDYSDTLQAIRQKNIEKTTPSRSKEAAI